MDNRPTAYLILGWGEDGMFANGPYTRERLAEKLKEMAKENPSLYEQYRYKFLKEWPQGDTRSLPRGTRLVLEYKVIVPLETVVVKEFELPE